MDYFLFDITVVFNTINQCVLLEWMTVLEIGGTVIYGFGAGYLQYANYFHLPLPSPSRVTVVMLEHCLEANKLKLDPDKKEVFLAQKYLIQVSNTMEPWLI